MTALPTVTAEDWSGHPFVTRLNRYIELSAADLQSLHDLIENELLVKKRRDLVVDGYEYRKLCFIESGFAARYKVLHNGKRQILNVLLPGDVVGLPGSFLERASYSVITVTDMVLHVCSIDAYVALCYRRPQFALALSWLAMQEAVLYAEHIIDTGRRTPVERVARFLVEIHARLAMVGLAGASSFDLPFSQEVMGDALGLSVPHLNRTLGRLRTDGFIKLNNRHVEFTDLNGIQMLGHFQPFILAPVPSGPARREP